MFPIHEMCPIFCYNFSNLVQTGQPTRATLETCRLSKKMSKYKDIKLEDYVQKTWIPEGTKEYGTFKNITQENQFLTKLLKEKVNLASNDLVLDVGGREGDISFGIQNPKFVHLVDPDPTIDFNAGKSLHLKIQDTDLTEFKYKLIICSHIWGYLGNQNVQKEILQKVINLLDKDGILVLFYNINSGYMGELLEFSKQNLSKGHYDYFDENLLSEYRNNQYQISHRDVKFDLNYRSYEDLARCCWFLFGAIDQDIDGVSAKFLPKLKKDLPNPSFPIEERITFIEKHY